MTWGRTFATFLALAITNYTVSPSVLAMGEEGRRTSAGGAERGTASEEQEYALREASAGALAGFVGGQDTTAVTFDPALAVILIVAVLGLFFILFLGAGGGGGGGSSTDWCANCQGKGMVYYVTTGQWETCPSCHGTGKGP